MATTVFNAIFLIAFLLSALVQYNDPDALPWILIYLAAAAMCILQTLARCPRWLPVTLLIVSLGWMGALLPAIVGQVSPAEVFESISMRTRAVEEAREIGGLALVAAWSAVLALLPIPPVEPRR
jgi:hypothetical protein